ncbi:MAG TPA: MBL fold metallo-hydrolase, partial [Candidatus Methylomirabilis sp.]|nr:MBL fold metallo-hydrolase [Candidatus Methylomirabilis sp.]
QHGPPSFPVEFKQLGAAIEFTRLEPERTYEISGLRVTPKRQRHAGDSYGYRFEGEGKVLVYSTDSEHKLDDAGETRGFVAFFHKADLVIFDAQYSLADAVSLKEDWGHSSNIVGVELCQMAGAKHLCLFHHEPILDDERLAAVLQETQRLEEITHGENRVRVSAAYDGMEIAL